MELARISYSWLSTEDTPYFTDPPHVTHKAEMEALQVKMSEIRTTLVSEVGATMDERGFASKEHNTLKILGAMDSHFEKMAAMAAKSAQTFESSRGTRTVSNQAFTMVSEDDDVADGDELGDVDTLLAHDR